MCVKTFKYVKTETAGTGYKKNSIVTVNYVK